MESILQFGKLRGLARQLCKDPDQAANHQNNIAEKAYYHARTAALRILDVEP
jgi:hypothetical protein